jgi:Mg-chelatase subunit ChlD
MILSRLHRHRLLLASIAALPALLLVLTRVTADPAVLRSGQSAFAAPLAPAQTSPTPTVPSPATATAEAGPGLCSFSGEHQAGSTQIEINGYLGLALTMRSDCPQEARGRADILLVVDHSNSMRDDGKLDAARAAVRQFIDRVDFGRHRVGLMPFNDGAYVAQPLTDNRNYLMLALANSGDAQGGTNIAGAIAKADAELGAAGRREAVHIIVLMTDGKSSIEPMQAAARTARENGRVLFTIGLGSDAEQAALRGIADTPDHFYYAPSPEGLGDIYLRIASMIQAVNVTDILLVDRLGQEILFAPGSGRPREPDYEPGGSDLRWHIPYLADRDVTVAYEVRVGRGGRVAPSDLAWADYTDGDGSRRRYTFAPPEVNVIVPEQHYAWLPVLFNNLCLPARRWSDVALVIDVSSSMSGGKLEAAVAAASRFVSLLKFPTDRAALVVYDAEARLVQPLTRDRLAVEAALASLTVGRGTRLDRGLQAGVDALLDPMLRSSNRPVIVLLSDGRQDEASGAIEDAIERAESWNITRYTIAFGADADRATLEAVAGQASRAFYAPDAATLDKIYQGLATLVGCR